MLNQKNEGLKLIIPTSVDVESIVSSLPNLSKTQSRNLENRIYYILSRVVVHNENLELYKNNNFRRTLRSEQMKKILGSRQYRQAMNLLMGTEDPVLLSDHKYQTGRKSKSYWLADKYNTGGITIKVLSEKLEMVQRIKVYYSSYQESIDMMERYGFLINQFNQHSISFDPSVFDYISNMYRLLKEQVVKNNKYQMMVIHNLIGRWLYFVDKVNDGDFNPLVSGKNHRLNSLFTLIPKNLRPWILVDGKPLIGVDVKACAPYLLASVMKSEFFNSGDEGYNLKTIYPSLFNKLYNRNMVQGIWDKEQNWVISNTGYNGSSVANNTGIPSSIIYNKEEQLKYSSFMWCQKFDIEEIKDIIEYQNISFSDDYYTIVIKSDLDEEITLEELEKERNSFKKNNMFILFDSKLSRRNNNPHVQHMDKCFRGVNKWLEIALESIGGKELSYILQRTESYYLLNKVSKRFNQLYPDAPLFTIHDCLFTTQEYTERLKSLISDTGLELTGILPGAKIECPRMEISPTLEDVEKHWKKAKWVTTQKKFDEKKRKVFQSNIDRAKIFLKIL